MFIVQIVGLWAVRPSSLVGAKAGIDVVGEKSHATAEDCNPIPWTSRLQSSHYSDWVIPTLKRD
jgi:hypothetical protein